MGLGVRVGRGANVKQTMFYHNAHYMFFHSSSLQDRRYFFCVFQTSAKMSARIAWSAIHAQPPIAQI